MTNPLDSAFWALPHDLRRSIARIVRPDLYRVMNDMRVREGFPVSLAPLDRLHCLFVHVPKAAGTSIARGLFGCDAGSHSTLRGYSLAYNSREFASTFKFTFVRNPWDRLFSAFTYLKSGGRNEQDRRWAEQKLAAVPDFATFVHEWLPHADLDQSYVHLIPQYLFLRISGDRPAVDFLGRFETIAEDYEAIRARIGAGRPLEHQNKTNRSGGYREAYTEEMKQIVARAYRKDIELLGYEFDRPAPR